MITVVSAHPASSKWWWNGAMRNSRRRVVRKTATCSTTDSASTTNTPPSTTSSSSVRVTIASPANSPPSASEPVSPMKMRGGRGVPPQEPDARAHARGRDERDVERVADLVAAGLDGGAAGVAELPERDDQVGREHHRGDARGEPVEAVGEVHGVRGGRDDQVAEQDEPDAAEADDRDVADERQVGRGRGEPLLVGELQREHPKITAVTSWPTSLAVLFRPRLRCGGS